MKNYKTLGFALTFGTVAFFTACSGNHQEQTQQVPELAVMTVGEQDATLETGYPASLHGENDVEIRPQITGFLTSVNVEEGQRVTKGQTLFIIDQVQLKAQVDAALAAVEQANASVAVCQANVNTAQTNANNNKLLFEKNIISQSAYQTSVDQLNAAKAQLNQAKASANQAKASLVSAQKSLSYSVVKAPSNGIVGSIDFKEGALVSPQSLLTVLSDNNNIEVSFSINEKEMLDLTKNGKQSLEAALTQIPAVSLKLANGEIYPLKGKVVSVSGVLDTKTGSATAKAIFANPDGMLRSGSTGQILIPTKTQAAMLVPQKATFEVQDMKFVYVLGDSSKVHSTPIQISELNDGQNYIVTGGIKPGDKIVVEGVGITVKDGMQIKPKGGNVSK